MNETFSMRLSRHAEIRANQRGVRRSDIGIIGALGTDRRRNRYGLDRDEASGLIAELKAERAAIMRGQRTKGKTRHIRELSDMIRSLERALKKVVVICGNVVVTTYPDRKRGRGSFGYFH